MAKVVVTVISDDEKFDVAIAFVYRSWTHRRFDDIRLLFFGPSQKRLAKLDGDLMKMVNELAAAGVVDSACIRYAEGRGIAEELAKRGTKSPPRCVAKRRIHGVDVLTT
jgi:hypothetical protein